MTKAPSKAAEVAAKPEADDVRDDYQRVANKARNILMPILEAIAEVERIGNLQAAAREAEGRKEMASRELSQVGGALTSAREGITLAEGEARSILAEAARKAAGVRTEANDAERAARALAKQIVDEAREQASTIPVEVRRAAEADVAPLRDETARLTTEIAVKKDEIEALDRAKEASLIAKQSVDRELERLRNSLR